MSKGNRTKDDSDGKEVEMSEKKDRIKNHLS